MGKHIYQIHLDNGQMDMLREDAQKNRRTTAAHLRWIIDYYFERQTRSGNGNQADKSNNQ